MDFKAVDRVSFDNELELMDVDFSGLNLRSAADVEIVYDEIEQAILGSEQSNWYFLVNYKDCEIAFAARPAHSRRGSRLNVMHSLGTVRYGAHQETQAVISDRPDHDEDAGNFSASRETALQEIADMRAANPDARKKGKLAPSKYTIADYKNRIKFLEDDQIMDVDFSNFSFDNASDVNGVYDYFESLISKTGKKWYFLVNLDNCKIAMRAWVTYAQRGKKINIASSLGSVRYSASPEAEAEIRSKAKTEDFQPNIRESRKSALVRINEMKKTAS